MTLEFASAWTLAQKRNWRGLARRATPPSIGTLGSAAHHGFSALTWLRFRVRESSDLLAAGVEIPADDLITRFAAEGNLEHAHRR